MAREVSIIVSAKDKISAGLGKAKGALSKFGASVKKIGAGVLKAFKGVAVAVGAAGAAIGAFAAKAVSAYAVQQKAEIELAAALRAQGDAVGELMPKYKELAATIQDQTGIADEATIAQMAQLRTLDVSNEKMEEAVKASIAFTQAGMGQEQATRAAALAVQGNYDMLRRYIPALRDAKDEGEQQAIVQDLITRGFAQQKEQLGTVSGRWGELKGRLGDAWEQMGRAITESTGLEKMLGQLSDGVKDLTEKFAKWVDSGGVEKTIRDVRVWAAETKAKFAEVGAVVGSFGEWLGSNISNMFQNLVDVAREKLHKAKAVIENWSYNIGLEISAAIDPNVSRSDIQDLYRTWDHGFDEIKQATINNLRGIEDFYKVTGQQLVEIEKEKNASIKSANDDLQNALDEKAKKAAERNKKESDATEQQLEETENQLESTKSTVEELTNALEVQKRHYEVIYDAVDKTSKRVNEFNKESSGFDVKKFVSNLEQLARGLSEIDATDIDLAWLDDIRKIDVGNLSGTKAAKFVNNVKRIAEGLGDIPFIDLPDLSSLKDLEIPKLDAREVDMLIRQVVKMDKELRFVNLPDLSLQLNMDVKQADAIKNMAIALKGINGVKAELAFKENITKAIVQNEKNTRSIAKTIRDAGGFG